ncbi:Protein csh3 [Exophiala xenobiotica]|uniref:Protein csh3 n=1 Tax=Lithohypha guttulata TaxID=1690604 RepID=A0ABR0K3F8_9EURO|nr:Protein csh3 [Lithohypha guttulata]KAK5316567.1 Protein csh3 [Exophiala xenobiotica]
MPQITFATYMIIAPTAFFLGLVFSLFPYDYPLLWSSAPISEAHLNAVEAHLRLLHNSPNIIVRIMHIITAVGLAGLVMKLYKPSESNMLFDGGSLVLYMIAVVVYLTNIVKGLRIVSIGTYGEGIQKMSQERRDDVDMGTGIDQENRVSVLGREDNLKVLAASNTILALVLVGVLVLQAGQWYAERAEEKERAAIAGEGSSVKKSDSKKAAKKKE